MSAQSVPASPTFASRAEQRVWTALRKGFDERTVLLPNVRFVGDDGDWEADFVVLVPDLGTAVVEVKGGRVFRRDGLWWQRTPDGDKQIDVVEQADRGKYLVRRHLTRNGMRSLRMAHLVAFPDMDWHDDLSAPNLPRNRVITRDTLSDAAGIVWDALKALDANEPREGPTLREVDEAVELLAGRLTPQRDVALWREVRDEHVARVTEDQALVLDVTCSIDRIEVTGGPGSGKTWLALEQTRRLVESGQRVALLCYSRGLAGWLQRAVAGWGERARSRVHVGSYHALGVSWGVEVERPEDQDYWDVELPRAMTEAAGALAEDQRFDAIVVDEAQDFADTWWPALLRAAKDPGTVGIYLFRDDRQAIFGRSGAPAEATLTPLRLTKNVRNSQHIARLLQPLRGDDRMDVLGGDGPPIRFVQVEDGADVYAAAEQASIDLLEDGWEPRDVAVVTTRSRHPNHRRIQEHAGRDGYWEDFWDPEADEIFYCTVAGFKGLERSAVVLAVDGFRDEVDPRDVLLVGLSRARDQLVVVGDLDRLRAVAGKELAKRLAAARDPSVGRSPVDAASVGANPAT